MNMLINEDLRLRPIQLPKDIESAISWYKDKEVLYYSEGERTLPYDAKAIERRYNYLSRIGELYIIEINQNNEWIPIGDVTLSKGMIPIVIGVKEFRGKWIGKRVLNFLINRAKLLGWDKIKVNKIYSYNIASRNMFESLGFAKVTTDFDTKGREYNTFELVLN